LAFNPKGDFTVEFEAKIINNKGRGLDVSFVTRDFSSPTIHFSHNQVGIATPRALLTRVEADRYHTYRLAVASSEKKIHLFVDGKFVKSIDIVNTKGGTPRLNFGKGHKIGSSDIYLKYISYDLTGAYKPE